jgi:hypothetical protein
VLGALSLIGAIAAAVLVEGTPKPEPQEAEAQDVEVEAGVLEPA